MQICPFVKDLGKIIWWRRTYYFCHAPGLIMVAPREPSGSIRSQIEHQPWILGRSLQHIMKHPTPLSHFLLPCHWVIRSIIHINCSFHIITTNIQIPWPIETSLHNPLLLPHNSLTITIIMMIQFGIVMVHGRHVHAALSKARKPGNLREWLCFHAIFRAHGC